MIIVLERNNEFYLIDQTNNCSSQWHPSIEKSLADMEANRLPFHYYEKPIEWYLEKYSRYTIYTLDNYNQSYEYW